MSAVSNSYFEKYLCHKCKSLIDICTCSICGKVGTEGFTETAVGYKSLSFEAYFCPKCDRKHKKWCENNDSYFGLGICPGCGLILSTKDKYARKGAKK